MWEYVEGQKASKIKGFHIYINPVVSHVETVDYFTPWKPAVHEKETTGSRQGNH